MGKFAYTRLKRALALYPNNLETMRLPAFAALAAAHPGGRDRIGVSRRALQTGGKYDVGGGAVA